MSTTEYRSINSGAIRRALERLETRIGDGATGAVNGTWSGTATPFPPSPQEGDAWLVGTPVPTVAPPNPGGGAATAGDVIVWTGSTWVNMGQTRGPTGPPGPYGPTGPPGPTGETGPPGPDEVWVGPSAPTAPSQELWVDIAADPPLAPGADEVWIGPSAPVGLYELWVDTSS